MSYISNNINNRYGQSLSNKTVPIQNNKNKATIDSKKKISTSDTYTKLAHQLGYTDYKVFDGTPITVHSERFGEIHNDFELVARFHEYNRKQLNKEINDTLDKNDIKLSANEKLNFTIDENQAIKVTGADSEERNKQIEQAINISGNIANKLVSSIVAVNGFNGKIEQLEYDKWEASKLLKEQTGQSLKDLKLVDGKIIGGNEKFSGIVDSFKDKETNEANYLHKLMVKKVKSVLSYGIDRIHDINFSIDFQNGELIDKDVKYGFNSNDLNRWIADASKNRRGIDTII